LNFLFHGCSRTNTFKNIFAIILTVGIVSYISDLAVEFEGLRETGENSFL